MSDFDREIDFDLIYKIAELIEHVPEEVKEYLDTVFKGDKDIKYYQGMIAASFNSFEISINPDIIKPEDVIRYMTIYIANKIVEDKKIQQDYH